ncbi:FecR family protein [Sinorhizobium sp. RAC02]|uniref:FecR family protein n=1 Tax=Sinorhizobium sp. RAC02 TaxID=1842534 RepID=UPI00085541CD|nr:FecR family protein [Sinorhizobium sp. RAC02]AOF93562.1 fecR family protein [Sinorhizobium sp. RAC02]
MANKETDLRSVALEWFVRMQSGETTQAERLAHARWLAEADEHRLEYRKLEGLWADFDAIPRPVIDPVDRGRRRFLVGTGAGLAAGLAGVAAWQGGYLGSFSDFSTGTGEQRTIRLADGSQVTLDADSAINVGFDERARRIHLLQGRAFFDVAADKARPFSVEASKGVATALGTRFSVHRRETSVTVDVEESTVSVVAPDASTVVLNAPETLSYGQHGVARVGTIDTEVAAAWRHGKLIFEDQPLGQVIEDVNRYRRGSIRIYGEGLQALRVSGIFDMANPDGVLDTITRTLPISAYRLTDYFVVLRPA